MKKIFRVNLLILLVVFLFIACEKKEIKSEEKELTKSVFVVTPKSNNRYQKRVFSSFASSNNQIKLSFKVKGNIKSLKIKIGDEVKKGQIIASVDDEPYILRVSQINYALSEAKASLKNAKKAYERVKKLYINQNASASDMDSTRALFEASSAKVKNISKELEYAKLQLSYTKLYAPIDGIIAQKFINKDENIDAGTPIVLISDILVDEVKAQIPESFINKIKKNSSVKVLFNSISSQIFEAKISEISKFTLKNETTYEVVAKLINSSSLIKSGMSAELYFDIEDNSIQEKFLLPSPSILNDKKGYFVYIVLNDNNRYFVKRKDIKVGDLTKEGFEVIEGLNKKDLVLKAGMSEVFENMEVVIGNKKELEK